MAGRAAPRRSLDEPKAAVPTWLFWLAGASVFLLLALLAAREVASLDVGFHLKAGEWILENHSWPRLDPFTYTLRDHPYVDTSWGFQVVLSLVHRLGGVTGLALFPVALVLLIFGVLSATARLGPADPLAGLLLLLLGGLAAEMRFEPRPELVSYLLLASVLLVLHRHAEGRGGPLWALPALHLFWANAHGLFVLGWVAIGCFVVGSFLRDRRLDRKLTLFGAASVVVTILNPYGLDGALFPLALATRFQTENVFAQSIGEFASPLALKLSERFPFSPRGPISAFRAFALLSLLALLPLWRQRRPQAILLWVAFGALSFRMIRNLPLLVVACLPVATWGLGASSLLERLGRRLKARTILRSAVVALVAVVALATGLRVMHDAYDAKSRRIDRFGLTWNREVLPVDAASFARAQGLSGPVLNHLNFGGYWMWALSDPVFIDGRLEVVGERFFAEYHRMLDDPRALEAAVARWGIRWIVFPYLVNLELLRRLSQDERWEMVYADGLASIFVRQDPARPFSGRRELPARLPTLVSVRSLPGLGGGARVRGWRWWLEGFVEAQRYPLADHNLGLFHLYRGELEQAAARFGRAVTTSGGAHYESYLNLGAALYRLRRFDEARACYEVVLEDQPGNRIALERLNSLPRSSSRP